MYQKRKTGIFAVMIMLTLWLAGCSLENEEFITETHKRDDIISRNFEMMTLEAGNVSYHIEMSEEDVENGNLEAYKKMLTEVKKVKESIEALTGNVLEEEKQEPTDVYFLENADNYEAWSKVIVIEKGYIGTEEFTYHLLHKLYDCEEWVAYGLSKYLLGEIADEAYLKDYYSEKENVADLSLFGAKFYDLNPDKEEQKAVRETALSLFTYILQEHEKEVAVLFDMSEDCSEQIVQWKNDWLRVMNISGVYENERETLVRQLRFVSAEGRYPVLMKFENYVFYLNDAVFDEERMENMDGMEKEFSGAFADVVDIERYLFENLSEELLQNIRTRKQYVIKCYFETEGVNNSQTHILEQEIRLSDIWAFPHESVHTILLNNLNYYEVDRQWIDEGIAEYLTVILYGKNRNRVQGIRQEEYYSNWDIGVTENAEHEIIRNHNKRVFDIYLSEGGKLGEIGFNYEDFSEIYLYTEKCVSNPEEKPWVKYDGLSSIYGMKINNGTADWSYMECMEFVEYLVERFGIQKVMEVNYEPGRIEEILGDTLMNLHGQWEEAFMTKNAT